jgi:hypothetical protein
VDLEGHDRALYRVPGTLKIQDIARDGRVLLVHELIWAGILARVPGEQGERELGWLDWSIGRKLSSDGKWLLFDESGDAPGNRNWVYLRRKMEHHRCCWVKAPIAISRRTESG